MNALLSNLVSVKDNPHVSVPVILALACELGKVWMPSHIEQWNASQKILIGYGIIAAGNSGPKPPNP